MFRDGLVEHARRLGDKYASIRDALAMEDALAACIALQADHGDYGELASDCAALLLAEIPPDSIRARSTCAAKHCGN